MNTNLNPFQRLLAETPKDAKIFQMCCLLIIAFIPKLSAFISADWITHISDYALAGAALAQFAIKECAVVAAAPTLGDGIADLIQGLTGQIDGLTAALNAPIQVAAPTPAQPAAAVIVPLAQPSNPVM